MTDKATPRPWLVDSTRLLVRAGPVLVAECHRAPASLALHREQEAQANAALIVRAVNAHDQLVEALRDLLIYEELDDDDLRLHEARKNAIAALRAAGVEP